MDEKRTLAKQCEAEGWGIRVARIKEMGGVRVKCRRQTAEKGEPPRFAWKFPDGSMGTIFAMNLTTPTVEGEFGGTRLFLELQRGVIEDGNMEEEEAPAAAPTEAQA